MKRTYYLHTIDGYPATYEPDPWPALIRIQLPGDTYPRAGGALVRSLRTLKAQQRRAMYALPASRRSSAGFGYVRVSL